MTRKGKAGALGTVTNVGYQLRESGTSTDLYAIIAVKLGNQRGTGQTLTAASEKRLTVIKKKLQGKRVQLYQV